MHQLPCNMVQLDTESKGKWSKNLLTWCTKIILFNNTSTVFEKEGTRWKESDCPCRDESIYYQIFSNVLYIKYQFFIICFNMVRCHVLFEKKSIFFIWLSHGEREILQTPRILWFVADLRTQMSFLQPKIYVFFQFIFLKISKI